MTAPAQLTEKLHKIKLLIMDVDGVMTDGRIILSGNGEWTRFYSVRDGAGIVFLQEAGYKTGVITGAASPDVKKRVEHLKINHIFQNQTDKSPAFDEIKKLTGYTNEEISYIGDDVYDIPVLKQVGFAVTVPGAMDPVKDIVHYVTKNREGHGAIRELCEIIMQHGFYAQKGV
jgi:3-deoxy-D-manno-octulosonate 8-phosphate phosphatase (KDO 8-P phosphatase)